MTDFNIRRRVAKDDMTREEVNELLAEMADHKRDEQRDRDAEEHFDKKTKESLQ